MAELKDEVVQILAQTAKILAMPTLLFIGEAGKKFAEEMKKRQEQVKGEVKK